MSHSDVVFNIENLGNILGELKPLLNIHHEEISHYKDIEFEPDFETYLSLQKINAIVLFTARVDGVLVGYNIYFVRPSLHYKKSVAAVQDVVFIHPEFRGFGRDFFNYCDSNLKQMKVQVTYSHMKAKNSFGKMLEKLGYELMDLVYAKRLDV